MRRTITIGLNSKEIENLASELKKIPNKLKDMRQKATNDLAEIGLQELTKDFNRSTYQPEDGMDFSKTGTMDEMKVSMIGTQAIYHEFGTGTMGKESPHPQKGDFSPALNEYNSGKTIRRSKGQMGIPEGELYWTYKDENGWIHYTQGIPAQKVSFDASETMKEKMPEVLRKAVEEVLK
jgi:hypothetical protein